MSGPDDSGSDDAPSGDFKLTPLDLDAKPTLSQRFRLKMNWNTPHLEWRPIKGFDSTLPGVPLAPPPPPPANPEKSFANLDRYLKREGYLFDLRGADFAPVDRAFQFAPTDPPNYTPTLAQIMAWQDQGFYRSLGRSSPFLQYGASSPMVPQSPGPSLFYKPPAPPPLYGEAALARPGKVGDALKAVWNLPVTQRLAGLASDELSRQYDDFKRNEWDKWDGWQKGTGIALTGVFVAGVVGSVVADDDARHFAADKLLGVDVPIYLIDQHLSLFRVPGTSVKIDGYGAASNYLLGPAADKTKPREFKITLMVDLREAFHVIATHF